MKAPIIYTIGHSTHSITEFLEMLSSFEIKLLGDVRKLPGSRKFPQFDQENLIESLEENAIEYQHLVELGGRRKVHKDSRNTRWNNDSFRGYADYMETEAFESAVAKLEQLALEQPMALMCAEAVWWRCHRSMISDYLKAKGWTVMHIMALGKLQEHPYTQPARIVEDQVYYYDEK